jgi:hypothetical protein
MRGIGYQDFRNDFFQRTDFIDPLQHSAICGRDIPYFKSLGINTLYVVVVSPTVDHSVCMKMLQDNGIFVLVNLGGKLPDEHQTDKWDSTLLDRFTATVEEFAKYPNTLGFRLWNVATKSLPFTKRALKDLKDYMRVSELRNVPIGYGSYLGNNEPLNQYLNCDGGLENSIDFLLYGTNIGCANVSQIRNDMDVLKSTKTSLPLFMANTVCKMQAAAENKLLETVYSNNYTAVHSGGVLFNYFDNASDGPGTK